jgi:tetratricopeptide (TPR) repeat protein
VATVHEHDVEQLKRIVARIEGSPHGQQSDRSPLRGTAFLITRRFALTCAHCLYEPGTYEPGRTPAPKVTLSFKEWPSADQLRSGKVVGEPDWEHDVALLELDQEAPSDIRLFPLCENAHIDDVWNSQAYPVVLNNDVLQRMSGTVSSPSAAHTDDPKRKILSLECNQIKQKHDMLYGTSGGPVLVDGLIVGMLSNQLTKAGQGTSYSSLVPSEKIPLFGMIYAQPIGPLRQFLTPVVPSVEIKPSESLRRKIQRLRWRSSPATVLISYQDYYGPQLHMHEHNYVERQEIQLVEAGSTQSPVLEQITKWVEGEEPYTFLILSGEGSIGKTRCCIEMAKGFEMRWIHLPGFKKRADDLIKGLKQILSVSEVCVYEDYQEHKQLFERILDIVITASARLIIVSREGDAVERQLISRRQEANFIHIRLKKLANLADIVPSSDPILVSKIVTIAEGNPGIALMAFNHYKLQGHLNHIEDRHRLLDCIYLNLQASVGEKRWQAIRPLIGKLALLRGLEKRVLGENYPAVKEAMPFGHIFGKDGKVHIQPDILNDHIAKKIYFETDLSPEFDSILREYITTHARHMLTTIINTGQKEAAEKLLRTANNLDHKAVIDLALAAYDGFKNLRLVQDNLGEFWNRVWRIDDPWKRFWGKERPDYYHKVGLFLTGVAKFDEANSCWQRALLVSRKAGDHWGAGVAHNNLGSVSSHKRQWLEAIEHYELAVRAFDHISGENAIWGKAETYISIGLIYASMGKIETARQYWNKALETFNQLQGKLRIFGNARGFLLRGVFYRRQGNWKTAVEWYERAETLYKELKDPSGLAAAYTDLSCVHAEAGDWKAAESYYQKARSTLHIVNDDRGLANVYMEFASIIHERSHWERAEKCYTNACTLFEQLGDARGMAQSRVGIAQIYAATGRLPQALNLFDGAIVSQESFGDVIGAAYTRLALGRAYFTQGDWRKSLDLFESAKVSFSNLNDAGGVAEVLVNIGNAYELEGDSEKARQAYRTALDIFNQVSDHMRAASILRMLGSLASHGGSLDEAMDLCEQSLNISKTFGNTSEMYQAYVELGSVYHSKGEWDKALGLYDEALKNFAQLEDKLQLSNTYLALANINVGRSEWERGLVQYEKAMSVAKQIENNFLLARCYGGLGDVYEKRGHWDEALAQYQHAYKIYNALHDPRDVSSIYSAMSWVWYRKGDLDNALDLVKKACAIAEKLQDLSLLSGVYENLGAIHSDKKEYHQAIRWYKAAIEIDEKRGNAPGLMTAFNNLGMLFNQVNQWEDAIGLFNAGLELARSMRDRQMEAYLLNNLGASFGGKGQTIDALRLFNDSLEIKKAINDPYGIVYTYGEEGSMYLNRKDWDEAEKWLIQAYTGFKSLDTAGDLGRIREKLLDLIKAYRTLGRQADAERIEALIG